jgi:hypothetical protein
MTASSPTLMPRKHAISTMFVKNVRKMTDDPKKRMQPSSVNRMAKLMRNRSR